MTKVVRVTPAAIRQELLRRHPKFRSFQKQLETHERLLRKNGHGGGRKSSKERSEPGKIVHSILFLSGLSEEDRKVLRQHFEYVYSYYQGGGD